MGHKRTLYVHRTKDRAFGSFAPKDRKRYKEAGALSEHQKVVFLFCMGALHIYLVAVALFVVPMSLPSKLEAKRVQLVTHL